LYFKVLLMNHENQHLDAIEDIKQLMQKSSRFISLSGWSGVAAGVCALIGAWVAKEKMEKFGIENPRSYTEEPGTYIFNEETFALRDQLFLIAALTFIAAFILAFAFTWLRSRRTNVPIWGYSARKLMINVAIPMIAGGLLIWKMTEFGAVGLVAPACLIFYGLGLINASKYTLSEIRYLGFCQLLLGVVNLWMIGYGLYFWAAGFGLLHIIYGIIMWNKYERKGEAL
jgi:hypothetical protein